MNKENKLVTINLDKERHLYFNLNSLELIERLSGTTIDKMSENMDLKMIRIILFAGLIHEDAELSIDYVGSIVGINDIERVSNAIKEAFEGLN